MAWSFFRNRNKKEDADSYVVGYSPEDMAFAKTPRSIDKSTPKTLYKIQEDNDEAAPRDNSAPASLLEYPQSDDVDKRSDSGSETGASSNLAGAETLSSSIPYVGDGAPNPAGEDTISVGAVDTSPEPEIKEETTGDPDVDSDTSKNGNEP